MYDVYVNGSALVPVGTLLWFAGGFPPTGWLECDGSLLSRSQYSRLFAVIGTLYGAGNGTTTFKLPDLKTTGLFVRSRSALQSVGVVQEDAIRNITGRWGGPVVSNHGNYASGAFHAVSDIASHVTAQLTGTYDTYGYAFDASKVVPTATENRPRNIAAIAIIRY